MVNGTRSLDLFRFGMILFLIPQGLSLSRNGFEVKEIKLNRSSVWKLALETAFQERGKKKEHLTGSGWKCTW